VSIEHLEAADLRQVVERYLGRLRRHRDQLNRLNVYPVPDGDTGTNMMLTVEAVLAEADGAARMDDLADALAHGSLMGAQGNSGIILSQVLRGFADVMRGRASRDRWKEIRRERWPDGSDLEKAWLEDLDRMASR